MLLLIAPELSPLISSINHVPIICWAGLLLSLLYQKNPRQIHVGSRRQLRATVPARGPRQLCCCLVRFCLYGRLLHREAVGVAHARRKGPTVQLASPRRSSGKAGERYTLTCHHAAAHVPELLVLSALLFFLARTRLYA